MTNVQVGMIAGAIIISSAIIGFAITGAKKSEPTPADRAEATADFVESLAENFQSVSSAVKIEIVRTAVEYLERQIEIYAGEHDGKYPQTLEMLTPASDGPPASAEGDVWGRAYRYTVQTDSAGLMTFDLHSVGPDGLEGTSDDIYSKPTK